ncbi:MAG: tetratricopeptide repeat protein [Ruminococcus sp.]|nr:tetratricopeptide repeat protein [Ruminococcus sp.]
MYKKILILLSVLFCLCGCSDQKLEQAYTEGMQALEKEQYDEAITAFETVIEGQYRLPETYRAYGIAWLEKESYPEAIAAFSRSLNEMETQDLAFKKDVMYYLAEARLSYGELEKAKAIYGDILEIEKDPQAFYLRGKAYLVQNDFENAEKDFLRAVDGCEDYNLYINIYQLYVEKNKTIDGNQYLELALAMTPGTGEDYYQRGRIYDYQKNYEKAKEELISSLKAEYADAMSLLGKIYLKMEDVTSARGMYQEYLAQGVNNARAYNGLAMCDIYEGKYDEALENIQKGLAENNEAENQGLLFNEIVAYEYKREFTTAKQKMQAYLKEYPEDAEALRENEFLSTR